MPLTDCPDCGNPISTEAFVCPKCGRPTGKQQRLEKKRVRTVLVLWVVLVLAFVLVWQLWGGK